ncbi:MAG: hypothetical protein WCQ76_05140 [Fusobacterium sp.]
MARGDLLLKYEQLEELVTQIYKDIKSKANTSHTHQANQINQDSSNRFVSDSEKTEWNLKVTKNQLDSALNQLTSGLTWKGSFTTLDEIQALKNPKDGWFAIATSGINTFYIYESTSQTWQDLGGMMLPGVATSISNGLMTKEMVNKLASLHNYTLPKATTSIIGGVKSGSVIKVDSNGVLQIDTSKVISTSERDKWNTASSEASSALSQIAQANTKVSSNTSRIASLETRSTALEGKLVYIASSDIEILIETAKK